MAPFTTPKPPAPRAGESLDVNGWHFTLQWHAQAQQHAIATDEETREAARLEVLKAQTEAIKAQTDAIKAQVESQTKLGVAMKEAATIQMQAVTAPTAPDSPAKVLQRIVVALTAAGADSACVMPRAEAILAALATEAPREMPPTPTPMPTPRATG